MKTRILLAGAIALAFAAGPIALPSLADAAQQFHGGGGHGGGGHGGGYHGGGGYRMGGAYHGGGLPRRRQAAATYGGGYGGGVYYGGGCGPDAGGPGALRPLRLLKPAPPCARRP